MDTPVASGSQGILQMILTLTADENRGATITRLIAEFALSSTTVAGAWGKQLVDLGLAMIERDAFSAAAVPDPDVSTDEPGRGWLYRTRCVVAQNGTGAPVLFPCKFDIRSQRKLDSAVLVLIINNTASTGTNFTVEVQGILRTLILLP